MPHRRLPTQTPARHNDRNCHIPTTLQTADRSPKTEARLRAPTERDCQQQIEVADPTASAAEQTEARHVRGLLLSRQHQHHRSLNARGRGRRRTLNPQRQRPRGVHSPAVTVASPADRNRLHPHFVRQRLRPRPLLCPALHGSRPGSGHTPARASGRHASHTRATSSAVLSQ